ncbi:MAG: DNA repair protein RadC [Deltaproteobacteria bacterium]|nr:DNA repair protein RadC [Deltaproteobacteria bacterium]
MRSDLVREDWPRERLERGGVEALSDLDLLALLLRSAGRGTSALDLAARLRRRYPTLAALADARPDEIAQTDGVGLAQASAICAAIALGRRADHPALERGAPITAAGDVYRHFHPRLAGLRQERFYVLLLDGKGRLQSEVRVSEGTLTASLVHPREVFRFALREAAASLILAHNHPSGDPTPSPEDESLTRRLCSAGELLGVRILDHVVIGSSTWLSFAETGRL